MTTKSQKTQQLQAHSKVFLVLPILFFILILTSFVSAEFLSVKSDLTYSQDKSLVIGTESLEYSEIWETYQPILIKDVIGLGADIFKGAITKHTESCGNDISCLDEFTIETFSDGSLIDDIKFYRLDEGKREERNIRSWNLYYYGDVIDYETKCTDLKQIYNEKNGTYYTPQECINVEVGKHQDWINYNLGDKLPKGTYKIKLEGTKAPYMSIDWVIKTQGKTLDEWATWGNISTGSQAEVILNSPANGATVYSNPVTINASANVTGGAYLVNMSLYDNSTGSWGLRNTTLTSVSNKLVAYYGLNEGSGTIAIDSVGTGLKNGTLVGTPTNVSGKISSAWNFSATGKYFNISNLNLGVNRSTSLWVKMNATNHEQFIMFTEEGGSGRDTIWMNATGNLCMYIVDVYAGAPAGGNPYCGNKTFSAGWNFVVWQYNNVTRTRELWLNNQLALYNTTTFGVGSNIAWYYTFPRYNYPDDQNMVLDEVAMWNNTLTSTDISSLWNNGNGLVPLNPTFGTVVFSNTYPAGTYNWNVEGCDSDGVCGFATSNRTFRLPIITNASSYSTSVYEAVSNTFTYNLTTDGTIVDIAYLNYNGTNYTASISSSGNFYSLSKSLTSPTVTTNTNLSFYWIFVLRDGLVINTTALNQTVNNFALDNCTTNTVRLYNFTIKDEATQSNLNGTALNSQAKISLQIYAYGTKTLLLDYNTLFNKTNPFGICINSTLTTEQYNLDAQIEYSSDGYETEFYHLQNETINISDFPTNISLYDLNTSTSQIFKIIFKDSSYLSIADALINVYRKYIDEGVFKIVEIPKTDANGETLAHLVTDDVIYNFVVTKNGVTLGSFSNVRAICQNPTITTCTIDFKAFSEGINIPDYTATEADFNYSFIFNRTSREITSTFIIPSGNASNVTLYVQSEDKLGTTMCTDYIISASGTLTCVVPEAFGNGTATAILFKDGVLQSYGQVVMGQSPTEIYGGAIIIIAIMVFLTLLGAGLSDNPVYTAIFLFVGVLLLFAMKILEGNGFIGTSATILFLAVGIILLIVKGGRRN
jgi:hypothetical protein